MAEDEERRKQALAHPVRGALLELLGGSELSARELRAQLDDELTISAVVYHLAVLQEADLVAAPIGGLYRQCR